MLVAVTTFPTQTIKSFPHNAEWDKRKYYLAQIIPPAKYKVTVWDKLVSAKLLSSAIFDHHQSKPTQRQFVFAYDPKNFADFGKYFLHFYNAETDEQGQFLLRKNARLAKWAPPYAKRFFTFAITPMKGSNLIPPDGTGRFVWQKIYVRKVTDALDSMCHHILDGRNTRCVINFFEMNCEWKRFIRLTLNIFWLADSKFFGILPDWINFFLVATFRHLINEAKRKKELGNQQMEVDDAKMVGIYWNAFAAAHKNGILLHRIRMADEQMVGLIDQFCQIDRSFLMGHSELTDQTKHENGFESFCPKWEDLRHNLELFTQNDAVMKAFDEWAYPSPMPNIGTDQSRHIVHFWLKMFSIWKSKERADEEEQQQQRENSTTPWFAASPWLPFDLCLFRQIGELFAKAASEEAFTAQKVQEIRDELSTICKGTKGTQSDFLNGNGPQSISILNRWRTFCANFEFLTLRQKNGHSVTDHLAAADNGRSRFCVICLSNELQIAFTPCRHLCVCEQCAKVVEKSEKPKCPVCRSWVEGTIRIYVP